MKKIKVGVVMGGFSAERHISVESGRNIYEKLASSIQYAPLPLFLTGTPEQHRLFILPINVLLKDNADDIHANLLHASAPQPQSLLALIQQEASSITRRYATAQTLQPKEISYKALPQHVDFVFIALHGRPGEDGTLQTILEQHGIPYNGSGTQSAQLTMDKFATNQFLRLQGVHVANHKLITKSAWMHDQANITHTLESELGYPLIAKPVDEGCSAAVIKIKDRAMLQAYAKATFRTTADLPNVYAKCLGLQSNAAFPCKDQFLAEALIKQGDASRFLEITGGLLTHLDEQGHKHYEIFAPSEALATKDILSLEEKFLAGEGQNITPARFHPDPAVNQQIAQKVKQDLEKVARLVNIEGYARIDAFVKVYDANYIETWIIEINSLPGMTPATCIFHQAALNGYTPFNFIHYIIQHGMKRHAQQKPPYEAQ